MLDPTNSRYRYLSFKGAGTYRRFIKENKELQQVGLVYQQEEIPAHGTYGALLFEQNGKPKGKKF